MKRTLWKWAAPVAVLALVAVWASAQEANKPVPIDPSATPLGAAGAAPYTSTTSVKTLHYVRQPDGSVRSVFAEGSPSPTGLPLGAPAGAGVSMVLPPGMGMPGMAGAYPSARVGEPMRVKVVPRTVYESHMVPMTQDEKLEIEACQEATTTLRSDKPEAEKAEARAVLAQLLLNQFNRDLESREKDVVELEAKVKKLREQLDKRKAAKEKIIELRMTTIQNEIDGLGFPGGAGMAPEGGFTGSAYGGGASYVPSVPRGLQPVPDPNSLPFPVRADDSPAGVIPLNPSTNIAPLGEPFRAKKYSPVELPPAGKKSEEEASRNILQNPSFEDGPQGWGTGNNPPTVEYRVPEKAGVNGTRAAEIKKSENKYFPISAWEQTIKHTGDAPVIQLSAMVKTENATKAILDVLFLDDKGEWIKHEWAAYIGDQSAEPKPLTHDWKEYKGAVAIPAGTKQIVIGLQDYGPGTVWFDDVSAVYLKELPKEPNNVPK